MRSVRPRSLLPSCALTSRSVRAMHRYRLPAVPFTAASTYPPRPGGFQDDPTAAAAGDALSTRTMDSAVPLMQTDDDAEVVFDGDEELRRDKGKQRAGEGELIPYAHRDIKPG